MGRKGRKKFTTWEFRDREVKLLVPVHVVDDTDHNHTAKEVYFSVKMEEPEINEQDTDINRLRQTVFAKIKEQLSIKWRSMLVVEVECARHRLFDKRKKPDTMDTEYSGDGSLGVSWHRVQIATFGKQKLSRTFNNYYKPWGPGLQKERPREVWNQGTEGWPEVGTIADRRGYPRIKAMIPDTPENRVALEAIADNIETLYRRLGKLLDSDQIENTLARVAGSGLLALGVQP